MQEQETDGAAQEVQEVQNAGPLHADGEEGAEDGQHQQEHPSAVAQGQNGEQEPGADDRHVPQLPQPELGLCLQVIRIDIHYNIVRLPKMKAAVCRLLFI